MRIKRHDFHYLLPVLVIALLVRLWGFKWGLPGPVGEMTPILRAWEFWNWGTGKGIDLNPHDFGWPSFIFYLAFLQQLLIFAAGRLTGAFSSALDFRLLYETDPSTFILWGRAFSTGAELGSVAAVFYLGRALFGPAAGAAAALVLSFDPHHIAWAQNLGPEVWVCLFVLLGSLSLLRVADEGRIRDYVLLGLWAGLGTAAKYTPIILFLSLPLAHWMSPEEATGPSRNGGRSGERKRPLLTLAVGAAAFFVTSPFVLLDPEESLFYSFSQFRRLANVAHFGQESLGSGWLFYLQNSLMESMGPVLLVIGVAGLLASFVTRRLREALVFLFPVVYFALMGAGSSKYDHYMLPVTPFLAIAGAGWLFRGARGLIARPPLTDEGNLQLGGLRLFPRERPTMKQRLMRFLPVIVVALGLVFPVMGVKRRHQEISRPDTRRLAVDWIEKEIPPKSLLLTEFGGPDLLSLERIREVRETPRYRDLAPRLLPLLTERPAYALVTLPLFTQEPTESGVFYAPGLYRGFDCCITSSEVAGRYRRERARFEPQDSFYRWLEEIARPIRVFGPADGTGPEIKIYSLAGAVDSYMDAGGVSTRRAWEEVRTYGRYRPERGADFATMMGRAYEGKGLDHEAALCYAVAIEFRPEEVEVHQALGAVFARLGQTEAARREYERVLALDPRHVGALNNLGGLELKEGRTAQARRLFERALELDPDLPGAHANLGWLAIMEGQPPEVAIAHFERAVELAPQHPHAAEIREVLKKLRGNQD